MISDRAADAPVLVVYTGGTFGMRPSSRGLVPSPDLREELAALVGASATARGFAWEYAATRRPIDSAEASPATIAELIVLVRQRLRAIVVRGGALRGVVIIHGTDTLAYTAARLAFEFADLPFPIVLTGSQRPLGQADSDAPGNFETALGCVAEGPRGVWIAFHGRRIAGVRATKVSSDAPDAFVASRPLAPAMRLGLASGLASRSARTVPTPPRVGAFQVFPGVSSAVLDRAVDEYRDGLVLVCYGAGTAPVRSMGLAAPLERARRRGSAVVAITQCRTGAVSLGRYAVGSELAELGAIDGGDLTLEAALGKISFLHGRSVNRGAYPELIGMNLLGEIVERPRKAC